MERHDLYLESVTRRSNTIEETVPPLPPKTLHTVVSTTGGVPVPTLPLPGKDKRDRVSYPRHHPGSCFVKSRIRVLWSTSFLLCV